MITKKELISYIKFNDRYFSNKYIDDYPYEVLFIIRDLIESRLSQLPKGFRLYSNGYDKEIEEFKFLNKNKESYAL